jgi:hypothetical protein
LSSCINYYTLSLSTLTLNVHPKYPGKNITGTLRYISLNVHEFKSPTIVDDLISLSYALVVIFTNKNLPWVGHKKDDDKFHQSFLDDPK